MQSSVLRVFALCSFGLFLSTPAFAYPDPDLNCDQFVDVLDVQLSIYNALQRGTY